MDSALLDSAVATARALGHPARLRAVAMLRSGELCVCQVTAVLGLAPSTVSLHLRELKRCGLVSERKQGRWVFVAVADDPAAVVWIDAALAVAARDPQLAGDARLVAELRRVPVEELCRLGADGVTRRARGKRAATRRKGRG
ncbi:MAG TPA: metalloregulator ArsR/SmtB family transcription factor [Thermoanaerobaculales bacterium]|nr:metalloregulator ArsR/SmtB family transcription factor [Thermoanaerobaculales bacterium]HQL29335.1 metalloregulator ArsR/SmtB family transcription factor [Thermoanaerobaculales bacterium]HQN97599.1 metalloregulator ArsR/SmtB family transcription factor [Thermoanaerobaculales bacterium]HQP44695.1 metalloregulator ArsR/SmtB family transcription factor [Thermoanaerobaculales bacterium]